MAEADQTLQASNRIRRAQSPFQVPLQRLQSKPAQILSPATGPEFRSKRRRRLTKHPLGECPRVRRQQASSSLTMERTK